MLSLRTPPFKRLDFSSRWILYLVIAAVGIVGLTGGLSERLSYTGDEPRYLLYALSFRIEGRAVMGESSYEKIRNEKTPGVELLAHPLKEIQPGSTPSHSILISWLLSPLVTALSLAQLRLVSLLAGLVGLCFLVKLILAQELSLVAALGCLMPAALFLPILPYYFLVLPEAYLILLVCVSFWNLLGNNTERLRDFAPSIICSCLAPFVHLRGLPLSIAVSVCLVLKLGWWRKPGISPMTVVRITVIYLAAAAAAILYNWLVYRSILGSVNTARPTFSLESVAAAVFYPHFGLLPYAPIFLLSIVGLIEGLWQRRDWSIPAGLFLVTMVAMTLGENPGESYPARYWVLGIPVLAICLLGFFQGRMLKPGKAVLYALLGIVSLANTLLFVIEPSLYQGARSGPLPYDYLFDKLGWVHLGFWLGLFKDTDYIFRAAGYCSIWIVVAAAASLYRSKTVTALAVVLLLLGFELHRAKAAKYSAKQDRDSLAVVVEDRTIIQQAPLRLTLRASSQVDFPKHSIVVTEGAKRWEQMSTNSVLLWPSEAWQVPLALQVSWERPDPDMVEADAVRVILSDSWLVRLWAD